MSPATAPPLPCSAPDHVADSAANSRTIACASAGTQASLPKALLQQWYMERYADFDQEAKFGDYFTCWHNGDKRQKLWTCVFTELTSGTERFVCGRWGNGDSPKYKVLPDDQRSENSNATEVNVVWYSKWYHGSGIQFI